MNSLDSIIKATAEDCAYTYKGLYKQSDIKEKYSSFLIFIPIIYSIIILVFPSVANELFGKIISVITLISSILLLVGNKNSENIVEYRKIANNYKALYDELCILSSSGCDSAVKLGEIVTKKNELNEKTSLYPIGILAKLWTKKVIDKEMNLLWIK